MKIRNFWLGNSKVWLEFYNDSKAFYVEGDLHCSQIECPLFFHLIPAHKGEIRFEFQTSYQDNEY